MLTISGSVVHVPLSQGKFAVVDAEDYPLIKDHQWYATCVKGKWYAGTNIHLDDGRRRQLRMHTAIMGSLGVDHRDGDGLNNRRSNLRVVTQAQNCKNRSKSRKPKTSPHKGVWWHKRLKKWTAAIGVNYRQKHLGYFDDQEDAAKAYDVAAAKLHGLFAKLNSQGQAPRGKLRFVAPTSSAVDG